MAELNGDPIGVDHLMALALGNYGHFTSMRVEAGRVRGLPLHLDRLVRDCRTVFDAELEPERLRHLVRRVVDKSTDAVVVRVTVFDPNLEFGHPGIETEPQVLVTTRPAGAQPSPPLRVRSIEYVRDLPGVKHVGLFGSIHQRRLAQLDGFGDVVFTDGRSHISEGATWNIGFFDGERLIWPDAEVLPGITMALVNQAHDGPVATEAVSRSRLPRMEAAFATNAAVGVRAVTAIDDTAYPDTHPVLDVLRKAYVEIPAESL